MGLMEIKNVNIYAFVFSVSLFSAWSCSPEKANYEDKAEISVPTGKEPTAHQLIQIGIQKLENWVDFWELKGANLHISNFNFNREYYYEVIEWPEENILSNDHPLKAYQIPNPASNGVVDIYDYKIIIGEGGKVDFNPDAEVVYFRSNGMRERLLFIGPSGVFEDAAWISEKLLLVSGHVQNEAGFVPVVWLILPEEHKYTVYENNFSTDDYSPESYLKEKLKDLRF